MSANRDFLAEIARLTAERARLTAERDELRGELEAAMEQIARQRKIIRRYQRTTQALS